MSGYTARDKRVIDVVGIPLDQHGPVEMIQGSFPGGQPEFLPIFVFGTPKERVRGRLVQKRPNKCFLVRSVARKRFQCVGAQGGGCGVRYFLTNGMA